MSNKRSEPSIQIKCSNLLKCGNDLLMSHATSPIHLSIVAQRSAAFARIKNDVRSEKKDQVETARISRNNALLKNPTISWVVRQKGIKP